MPRFLRGGFRLQGEQQRRRQRQRDSRDLHGPGHDAQQDHGEHGRQQGRAGVDERRDDDGLAVAEREHERERADRVQDLDRGREPGAVEAGVDRLREVRHRERDRDEQEAAQHHVEEDAGGIHGVVRELDDVGLHAPGGEDPEREQEPQRRNPRRSSGR